MSFYRKQSLFCWLCSPTNSWPVHFPSSEIASSNPSLSMENQSLTSPLPVASEYFAAIYHSTPIMSCGSNQLTVFHPSRTFQLLLSVSCAARCMPWYRHIWLDCWPHGLSGGTYPNSLKGIHTGFPVFLLNASTAFCSS